VVDFGVEQHVERGSWVVIDAHVERVAVTGQRQAVVWVRLGLFVLDVCCFDPGIEMGEPASDAVLFCFAQVERDGPCVVGLEQFGSLTAEFVTFQDMRVSLLLGDGVELVELRGDQVTERGDDVFGYLDKPVVVFDGGFDIGDEHGFWVA